MAWISDGSVNSHAILSVPGPYGLPLSSGLYLLGDKGLGNIFLSLGNIF